MVSAQKAFSKEPPREPLTSLGAIRRDFIWRYVDRKKTDQVIEYCRDAPKYAKAVRRAVEARDANGKHHNHQSKVDITARRKLGARLCSPAVKRIAKDLAAEPEQPEYDAWVMGRFDRLHDLIDQYKPKGIGPVTVYDVAVRLGAYLGIEPQSVYMHAGVRQGAKALADALCATGRVKRGEEIKACLRLKAIPMHMWPKEWRDLPADDIEDMLCTYREVFDTWSLGD